MLNETILVDRGDSHACPSMVQLVRKTQFLTSAPSGQLLSL